MNVVCNQASLTNEILASLPAEQWEVIRHSLVPVRLVSAQTLVEPHQPGDHAHFMESGVAAVFTSVGERNVQVGMIGQEGMVDGLSLLGGPPAPVSVVMTLPGRALRIPLPTLRSCIEQCPALRDAWLAHLQSLITDVMQIAAQNVGGTLEQRCGCWLLMAHDRVDGPDLPITHESLAGMLGVFRSAVTIAIAALQERGLISTGRGRISVIDERGLRDLIAQPPRSLARRFRRVAERDGPNPHSVQNQG
jgi:CRP-like cAMP-binding protein